MYYGLKCIERIDKQYQSSLSEWIRKVTESGLGNRQWGEKMRQKNRGEGERAGEERGAGRDEINGGEGGEDEADLSKSSVTLVSRTMFCFHYL